MSFLVPAEWAPHRAIWVGFPSHAELWREDLAPAQAEVAALARALADPGGERVRLLVMGDDAAAEARRLLDGTRVEIVRGLFGDIWLRDTGPIFAKRGQETVACAFKFNGWGGKYELEFDDTVGEQLAAASGSRRLINDFVLEGGALDHDGFGTVLTTRQCLLNPNRNPGWKQAEVEQALGDSLGVKTTLWLGDGLLNDHTDGHVDNLARFVAPGVVACPISVGRNDPNSTVYDETARLLGASKDARGRPLQVMRIPSPGLIQGPDHRAVPASHMNFVVANEAVIVPLYGDERISGMALDAVQSLFPERKAVGLPSTALLSGGGSFHCITQQEPA
jgi:agmatine deiminase